MFILKVLFIALLCCPVFTLACALTSKLIDRMMNQVAKKGR